MLNVGDFVKLNPYMHGDEFEEHQGEVTHDEVGEITRINDDYIIVDFPSDPIWHGVDGELQITENPDKKTEVVVVFKSGQFVTIGELSSERLNRLCDMVQKSDDDETIAILNDDGLKGQTIRVGEVAYVGPNE